MLPTFSKYSGSFWLSTGVAGGRQVPQEVGVVQATYHYTTAHAVATWSVQVHAENLGGLLLGGLLQPHILCLQ
jgi:hypothetical protein